jgi:hypothetical protein
VAWRRRARRAAFENGGSDRVGGRCEEVKNRINEKEEIPQKAQEAHVPMALLVVSSLVLDIMPPV